MNDLTGETFGNLLVIQRLPASNNHVNYLCVCNCGNETIATSDALKSGHKKSCGCLKRRSKYDDLTGRQFGHLTVKKFVGIENRRAIWRCRCECGKYTNVRSNDLKSGNTKSCGCGFKCRTRHSEYK